MAPNRRNVLCGSLALAGGLLLPRLASATPLRVEGTAFGTTWSVTATDDVSEPVIRSIVGEIVEAIDRSMSPFLADSEISRFNASSDGSRLVSTDFSRVAQDALKLRDLTHGAFDPGVGPSVNRFGFGPIGGSLAAGSQSITVDGPELKKSDPDATLDLCGIAKGYALEQIRHRLSEEEIYNAVIDVGGEVACIGHHPSGRHWRVGVAEPGNSAAAHCIVEPRDRFVATSGLGPNGMNEPFVIGHIINPRTQRPIGDGAVSVSVIAERGALADGWATALCALPLRQALELAHDRAIDALLVESTADGLVSHRMGRFSSHVVG